MILMFKVLIICYVSVTYVSNTMAEDLRVIVDKERQTEVAVTIYNGNFAVVRDKRDILLPVGEFELEFQGVARSIDPSTVSITSEDVKKELQVLEQSYRYDLLNKQALLERFLGRKLKYSRSILEGSRFEKVLREGILLSINPEVVRFGDEIEIEPEGIISLAYLPDDLKTTPTLLWSLENETQGDQGVIVSYLTDNISWQADYVLELAADESEIDLTGWVTIRNQSGAEYEDARLKLVAGDVQRVRSQPALKRRAAQQVLGLAEAANAGPSRESFFEYHLYDFPRRTTLESNSEKQIKLLTARGIAVGKAYVMQNDVMQHQAQGVQKIKADVILSFRNTKKNGLNAPLPEGKLRVLKADRTGILQLVGEDRIRHTPVNSDVEVKVGRVFDVTADRKQVDYRRLGNRGMEVAYSMNVKNHKNGPVELMVKERLNGDWAIIQESHRSEKLDSTTIAYRLKLQKGAEQTITYTARFNY